MAIFIYYFYNVLLSFDSEYVIYRKFSNLFLSLWNNFQFIPKKRCSGKGNYLKMYMVIQRELVQAMCGKLLKKPDQSRKRFIFENRDVFL